MIKIEKQSRLVTKLASIIAICTMLSCEDSRTPAGHTTTPDTGSNFQLDSNTDSSDSGFDTNMQGDFDTSEDTLLDNGSAIDSGSGSDNEPETTSHAATDTSEGTNTATDNDEVVDKDSDNWIPPFDCNDTDPNINPDAQEVLGDSVDNDCDSQIDEPPEGSIDRDGDGYAPNDGDCLDVGEGAEFVNPDAIEDLGPDGTGDGVDNDCDGFTDESEDCDCPDVGTSAWDLVDAIELCNHSFVTDPIKVFSSTQGELAFASLPSQGTNDCIVAQKNCEMIALSTGPVGEDDPNDAVPLSDPTFTSMSLDPLPDYMGDQATTSDRQLTCELAQLRLQLEAPSNALGFSFDFLFASAEYPEWINRGFNDTFYAIIEHPDINGGAPTNISFDSDGNEIEVDVNFFENALYPCDESGSGWAPDVSGSTGWLRTSWSISPSKEFILTFSIHDEGDCRYDSIVFIDNFRWQTSPVEPGTHPVQ